MNQSKLDSDKQTPGESVWDYPRPPKTELCTRKIKVIFNQQVIAETNRAIRVLETSHPPVYHIPPDDLVDKYLVRTQKTSFCEFKGRATYFNVTVKGKSALNAGFGYTDPTPRFEAIRNYVAFYAGAMDACLVDEETVTPQPGGFYSGWITRDIRGPFKGEPKTWGW